MSLQMPQSPVKCIVDSISIYHMEKLLTLQLLRMDAIYILYDYMFLKNKIKS
jgi:hypothetical protein